MLSGNGFRSPVPKQQLRMRMSEPRIEHAARGDYRLLLDVAEPPVRPPRLHGCHPTTKRIKNCDNCVPEQVDPAQADAVTFWKVAVLSDRIELQPTAGGLVARSGLHKSALI
jgi:hypothetical protein